MKVLAINTSDDVLSVALGIDSTVVSENIPAKRDHNNTILILVEQLLSQAQITLNQLDAVAFGDGPGSFTGLRISAGVAQGIAFGVDVPVVPVSCMAAIAQKQQHDKVAVAMDAKKNKIYWGLYVHDEQGFVWLHGEEKLTSVSEVSIPGDNWIGAGSGWDVHSQDFLVQNKKQVIEWTQNQHPNAIEISILGAEYLRRGLGKEAHLAIPRYMSPYLSG